jgi:surface protein
MFHLCKSLTSVDLLTFNTSNVTNMESMFYNCSKLTTIFVSNTWDVSNVTNSRVMFSSCTSLKGGGTPQTTYDANHIDKEYARIDGGANSSTPGYLTLKTN